MVRCTHESVRVSLVLCALVALPRAVPAQELDLSITDPDEIAAVCGGDAGAGEPIFAQSCAECHAVRADDPGGSGPTLHAVFGRSVGGVEGYAYSDAMRSAGEDGMTWERETLRGYIAAPHGFLPGTAKAAIGIEDESDLSDLMTYLRTATMPVPPDPADVTVPEGVLAIEPDLAYGEYLASECVTCHRIGQGSEGVPQINGWPREAFIKAMFEYRVHARANRTMQMAAQRLDDAEIAALAAYFESAE